MQRARQPANRHHRKEKRGATGAPLFCCSAGSSRQKPHDEKFARRGYLKPNNSSIEFRLLTVPSTRIIREYTPQYPDPLSVAAGESVSVGREDDEFPGWKWLGSGRVALGRKHDGNGRPLRLLLARTGGAAG